MLDKVNTINDLIDKLFNLHRTLIIANQAEKTLQEATLASNKDDVFDRIAKEKLFFYLGAINNHKAQKEEIIDLMTAIIEKENGEKQW